MNKNITSLAAVSVIALTSSANALDFRPYVGAQYNATHVNAKGAEKDIDMHSYSVFVGTEYNKYFGTEVFYQNSNKWHKMLSDGTNKIDFDAYGLDVYGYLPLGCEGIVSLIGTTGIANYDFDYATSTEKGSDNGLGYRLGGGIQYNVTNNIGIRALGRYVWTDKLDGMDHLAEFSLGMKYTF